MKCTEIPLPEAVEADSPSLISITWCPLVPEFSAISFVNQKREIKTNQGGIWFFLCFVIFRNRGVNKDPEGQTPIYWVEANVPMEWRKREKCVD